MKRYTLLAVRQDDQWASLCPELDIASCGDTADEALDMLEHAITEALAFEKETGISAGAPVPPDDLATFLEDATGPDGPKTRSILL